MSDPLKPAVPDSLQPALRYADALSRYESSTAKLNMALDIDLKYNRVAKDEFLRAFADYRNALIAEDIPAQILAEESVFNVAQKHGYAVDVSSAFYSLVIDFSFHVQLVSSAEREALELIS